MAHVTIRNRKTGALWDCPERVLDEYLANGWSKAAKSADQDDEKPAAASRDNKES